MQSNFFMCIKNYVKICVGKNHIPFIPDDAAHSLFNQFVENPKHSTTFVAEKNGKCVGVAISQYHHTLHYLGPICNLQNHFVEDGFRNLGAGSELLKSIEKAARMKVASLLNCWCQIRERSSIKKEIDFMKKEGITSKDTRGIKH